MSALVKNSNMAVSYFGERGNGKANVLLALPCPIDPKRLDELKDFMHKRVGTAYRQSAADAAMSDADVEVTSYPNPTSNAPDEQKPMVIEFRMPLPKAGYWDNMQTGQDFSASVANILQAWFGREKSKNVWDLGNTPAAQGPTPLNMDNEQIKMTILKQITPEYEACFTASVLPPDRPGVQRG